VLKSEVSRETLFASGQMLDDLPVTVTHHSAGHFLSAEIDKQCSNALCSEIETKGQPFHGIDKRLAISI
jgi:hypothetical protein